jgi:malate permease and related proteins
MLFNLSLKTTMLGMVQILILGGIGFLLVKRQFLKEDGLSVLSKLVIELTLPFLIFSQLITGFNFSLYRNWWWFPLISLAITLAGFGVGKIMVMCYPTIKEKRAFISLVGFQNSGYLPLVLFAAMFPGGQAQQLLIYLFLFLMGFNLIIWSLGVWYLTPNQPAGDSPAPSNSLTRILPAWLKMQSMNNFELVKLFSPPVVATVASLLLVALGLNRLIPAAFIKPIKMIGECTPALAMVVVGGNLAAIPFMKIDGREIVHLIFAKLLFLPVLAFIILLFLRPPPLVGLLIITQAAMPSATSLSLMARHYKIEERVINQGVLFSHLVSIVTVPLFLSLFLASPLAF